VLHGQELKEEKDMLSSTSLKKIRYINTAITGMSSLRFKKRIQ
jgi:hypothetical protein